MTASFVKNGSKWKIAATCPDDSILNWTAVEVEGSTVINLYQPPVSALNKSEIPIFPPPCIYARDFNCHSIAWGYQATSPNGSALGHWLSIANVTLLHDPHQPHSFRSGRWNTTSNRELAFANVTSTLPQSLVLDPFPRSQHRPSFITPHNPVEPIPTKDVKRWNFRKAKWEQFAHLVESGIDTLPSSCTPGPNIAYTTICQLLSQSAKKTIPRGCRQQYIRTWYDECNNYYKEFDQAENKQSAADLMDYLNKNRKKRWEETVKGIDFIHSSRKAWKTFNRLTGRKSDPKQCPITSIAKQLLANGHFRGADKQHDLSVKRQCGMMWRVPEIGGHLTTPFTTSELKATIKLLKGGKAQGPDKIPTGFMMHCGKKCLEWVRKFYSFRLEHTVIPKIWRRATVVAILKPNKSADDANSYNPFHYYVFPIKFWKN